jgi:hypothetical protein
MPRYCVVESDTIDELVEEVRSMMARGWSPQGGVSCTITEWSSDGMGMPVNRKSENVYLQAMIFKPC